MITNDFLEAPVFWLHGGDFTTSLALDSDLIPPHTA